VRRVGRGRERGEGGGERKRKVEGPIEQKT